MSERESLPEPPTQHLPWAVPPWAQPFWYAYVAYSWWQVGVLEGTRGESGIGGASTVFATTLLPLAKCSVCLLEAAFYRLLWRSRGRTLPFWRFFCVVASASMADVVAIHLGNLAEDGTPALIQWLAPIAGLAVAGDAILPSATLRAAFGTVGLLTAVRIGLTGWAQSKALGPSLRVGVG